MSDTSEPIINQILADDFSDFTGTADARSRALVERRIAEQLLKLFKICEDHDINLCALFHDAARIYDPD